jgi:hypothetical protein
MVKPQWHDRLRHELSKRGLPSTYSARLIEELTDHFADIQKENPSMDAQMSAEERLGTPDLLAAAAAAELGGRTFADRHPILTFVVGPIPAVAVTWYAVMILIYFAFKSLVTPYTPAQIGSPTAVEWAIAYGCLYVSRFLPFLLTAWLFSHLGRRARRPIWGMAACGIVAYFAFIFLIGVHAPNAQHNLSIGFGPALGLRHWQDRLVQALLPLAIGVWTWRQTVSPRKNLPGRRATEPSSLPARA